MRADTDVDDRILRETVGPALTGLCYALPDDALFLSRMGRNTSGVVHLDGTSIFVKRIRGMDGEGRFDRSRAFHECGVAPGRPFRSPDLLASDRSSLTLVYEHIDDADSPTAALADESLSD